MDKIEDRLHDTSKNCFECYQAWAQDKKNAQTREKLQEAIHELRKVSSRLEIELAVNEREEMAKRPISIPPHRDAKRRAGKAENGSDGGEEAGKKVEIKKRTAGRTRSKPDNKASEE